MISAGAAATGFSVRIFATFYGLLALTKKGLPRKIDSDFKELDGKFFKIVEEKGLVSGLELLKKAKEAGDTKIYACSLTYDAFNIKRDDLTELVDDVVGVGEFLQEAKDSDITLFI